MKYSLIISTRADPQGFGTLKEAITELYPDFSFERTIKEESMSETAIYVRGNERICAEINFDTKEISASSDIPLTELSDLFALSKKAASINGGKHLIFRNPRFWKYVIIPGVPFLVFTVNTYIQHFPLFDLHIFIEPLLQCAEFVFNIAYPLGWIWFIPVLAAAIAAARFKKEKLYKIFVAAMPLLSAVRLCIAFPDICSIIFSVIVFIPMALRYVGTIGSIGGIYLILILYTLVLPYMIADDIAGNVCERSGGRRTTRLFSVICWLVSAVVSIMVIGVTAQFGFIKGQMREAGYRAAAAAERKERSLEYDRIYKEYGEDMTAAAEYAVRHRYFDWYNCPEPAMKPVWERLFLSGNAGSDLRYSEEDRRVEISVGNSFNYYIYTDRNELWYEDKNFYYGDETV